MKNCIDCIHNTKKYGCLKNLKPKTCKKYKPITIENLQKELNSLKVSKENPTRQKELENKIDYFNWGIE